MRVPDRRRPPFDKRPQTLSRFLKAGPTLPSSNRAAFPVSPALPRHYCRRRRGPDGLHRVDAGKAGGDVFRCRCIRSRQRTVPVFWKIRAHLRCDIGCAIGVAAIVKNGIAEQRQMRRGCNRSNAGQCGGGLGQKKPAERIHHASSKNRLPLCRHRHVGLHWKISCSPSAVQSQIAALGRQPCRHVGRRQWFRDKKSL